MSSEKHSPLPWTTRTPRNTQVAGHVWSGERLVAACAGYTSSRDTEAVDAENHANAELIVRAVNAHGALVEALGACVELVDKLPAFSRESSAIEQARAALALAEEK